MMNKKQLLYEGKTKKLYETDNEELVILEYKDDLITSKAGTLNKAVINNKISNLIFSLLEKEGIKTHFIEELNDRETLVKKIDAIPVEVIVRNCAAGALSNRLGIKEGTKLPSTVLEYFYKDNELGDPMINDYHIQALGLATLEDMVAIASTSLKINSFLKKYLKNLNLELIDFKLEFGKLSDGSIIVADEISPDTCRFWDTVTNEKFDKEYFRRDREGLEQVYQEILKRFIGI